MIAASRRKDGLDGRLRAAVLVLGYVVLACTAPLLAMLVGGLRSESLVRESALLAGMLGFSLLCLQVILAGRFGVVERPFGLDAVMRFHKAMGILAGVLLVSHPVLLMANSKSLRLLSFGVSWRVSLGQLALTLLIAGLLYALLVNRFRLNYQWWRILHKGMIAVVVLGFVHGLVIGHDLRLTGVRVYWWSLFLIAAGVFVWRNLFVPLWFRRRFLVASVEQESQDTFSLHMVPEDGQALPRWNPGQFIFLKLIRPGRGSEEHPFTISASPTDEGRFVVTIKKSGDFTNTIDQTRVGDEVRIEGPFGRFSYVHHQPKRFLFIAGGVGITPIRSMLRFLADTTDVRSAVLVYGNKTEKDILFRDEFDQLGEGFRVIHVLSNPQDDWTGPKGYITKQIIQEHAGEGLSEADVYLCGPSAMMKMVLRELKALGVDSKRIHFERFAL